MPHAPPPPLQKFEVTPLELLFDLIFVFAISQLSHHLLEHLTWRDVLEGVILLMAVYRTWCTTSWDVAMLGVDRPVARAMLLVCMLLGLFMNAAIPDAFEGHPWAFAWPFIIGMVGRALWMSFSAPLPLYVEHFRRTSLWKVALSVLWLWGATLEPSQRLWVWALAGTIDFVAGWLDHPLPGRRFNTEHLSFDADHMLERNRLFLLIALGESVMTTGVAITEQPKTLMTLVTGTSALAATVALWAVLFGRIHELTLGILEKASDPARAGRTATNNQILAVAGLIALAVGNERVITHPHVLPSVALSVLLFGGPLLVQLALALFLWLMERHILRYHLIAGAVLILGGLVSLVTPPYMALILAAAVLCGLAFWEQKTDSKRRDLLVHDTLETRVKEL